MCNSLNSLICSGAFSLETRGLSQKGSFCYHFSAKKVHFLLTLLRLLGFGDFRKKTSSFRLPYQRPSSSAECATELFSGSNGSASLIDCTRKKFLPGGCGFFVSDVISGGL